MISEEARKLREHAAALALTARSEHARREVDFHAARLELRAAPSRDFELRAALHGLCHQARIDLAYANAKARLYEWIAKGGRVG